MTHPEVVPAFDQTALKRQRLDEMLDEAGLESFPASDPPGFAGGTATDPE